MRVSVAISTYKGEAYLLDQLKSIAAQSRLPDELVLTDDSPDSQTTDIAKQFAQTAPFPVTIVRNPRQLGFRQNFFKAISLCGGDVIALCDQDDRWMTNKLERMLREFDDPDVLLAIHGVTLVDQNLRPIAETAPSFPFEGTYAPLTVNPWYLAHGMSMMVRPEIFHWISTADEAIAASDFVGHDLWIWFVASSLGKIVGIPEPLALYRQHAENVFGAPEEATGLASVRQSSSTGVSHYLRSAQTARARAALLDDIQPIAPQTILRRAQTAATHYRGMADRLEMRALLYASSGRLKRFDNFLQNLRSGAYKPVQNGGFGRKAMAKDLYLGIIRQARIA